MSDRLQWPHAPVAQLDRVLVSEAKGHRFESCRARHSFAAHAVLPRRTFLVLGLLSPLLAARARADEAAAPAPAEDDPKARRIVEDADRIRFPGEGFQVDIAIVTTGNDRDPEERK